MPTSTPTIPAKNVDDYLEAQPPAIRRVLEKLRKSIRAAAPKAEELISYQIPTYKLNGPLVHFAAFRDHCSFIVVSKSVLTTFKKELQPYRVSGRTIHFTPGNPLPASLIRKIVKTRVRENEERAVPQKASRKTAKKTVRKTAAKSKK